MYTLKKSLGQHFLHDRNIAKKIVQSLPVSTGDQVLEIGPGGGALTQFLLEKEDIRLKAIEVDREKVNYLLKHFPLLEGRLIHTDFLKSKPPFEGPFHIIGNFPYMISSQILFKILDWKEQVKSVTGMFQKEVARRVAAPPGNKEYGILSVLMQAFYKVEYLFEVHEKCFTPPPKVKSAVIRLTTSGNPYDIKEEQNFILLVKTAFRHRRKVLRNPLKPYFCIDMLQSPLFSKRAEELSVSQFVDLSKKMLCRKTSKKS